MHWHNYIVSDQDAENPGYAIFPLSNSFIQNMREMILRLGRAFQQLTANQE